MALPSNTDWDFTYDEGDLAAGEQIKTTIPTVVLRNMDYSLRRNRMLASHVWTAKRSNMATPSWDTLFEGYCCGPNVLGTSVSSAIAGCVKAWASDASTQFNVRIYNASYGTLTAAVAAGAGAATAAWRGWMTGTLTAPGDDTLWQYDVDVQVVSGTGYVYLAGVGLFY